MTDRHETVADIVADIRERADNVRRCGDERPTCGEAIGNLLLSLADRIEAAAKLERGIMHDSDKWNAFVQEQSVAAYWRERCHDAEEMANKCGNAEKLREALEKALMAFYNVTGECLPECEAALAAPPRNCDVGTAGNAAKLREALEVVLDECCHHLCAIPDQLAEGGQTCDWRCVMPGRCEAIDKAKSALAAPVRNCDMFATAEDAVMAWNHRLMNFVDWLFAKADEAEGGDHADA